MGEDPALVAARRAMVREQLAARGIRDRRVLDAMQRVPRERFVPEVEPLDAYADGALLIACGQTISQPYIVALMTEALALTGHERVLEIGTGSGYQAAVLAELTDSLVTVERHAALAERARRTLAELGYQQVQVITGDGTLGYPPGAPYDRIIVTAAADRWPPALWDQLREGGLLVMPVGPADSQWLERVEKRGGRPNVSLLTECRFVPLVGPRREG